MSSMKAVDREQKSNGEKIEIQKSHLSGDLIEIHGLK